MGAIVVQFDLTVRGACGTLGFQEDDRVFAKANSTEPSAVALDAGVYLKGGEP
jgi:hypothetical protein